jgi:hypothetical protein
MLHRLLKSGFCNYADLRDGLYSWYDVKHMLSMLDLSDWLEWEQYKIEQQKAEQQKAMRR